MCDGKTRMRQMTHLEMTNIEHASRTATAWAPESYDGETHYGTLLTAVAPALFIIGVAAAMLFALI
jgi:hypothetical protein